MLHVIWGIFAVVIDIVFFYDKDNCFRSIILGIVMGILCGTLSFLINCSIFERNMDYETLPTETHELKEFQDNRYFEVSSENTVSICILNADGSYELETYDKELVSFSVGDRAQVSIVKEEVDWDESNEFWFWYKPKFKERIQSVTITIPSDSFVENEVVKEVVEKNLF